MMIDGYWWRGYSPYENHWEKLNVLYDALLIFENDVRFDEHVICLAKIFEVEEKQIVEDYYHLKGLKVWKGVELVERRGDFNWTSMAQIANGKSKLHHSKRSWNYLSNETLEIFAPMMKGD